MIVDADVAAAAAVAVVDDGGDDGVATRGRR